MVILVLFPFLVGIIFVLVYCRVLVRALWRARQQQKATGESFRSCFVETFKLSRDGMGPMELRLRPNSAETTEKAHPYFLEVRGKFPVQNLRQVTFVTSIFDVSGAAVLEKELKHEMVLCGLLASREKATPSYQNRCGAGEMKPGFGYARWIRIAAIVPESLTPARSGTRRLKVVARLVDTAHPPSIRNGFCDPAHFNSAHVLWQGEQSLSWEFKTPGWMDAVDRNVETQRLVLTYIVQIALAVAMPHGHLSEHEGALINGWMTRKTAQLQGPQRDTLRDALNESFKKAYVLLGDGGLDALALTRELRTLAVRPANVDCLELLYAILGADNVVEASRLSFVRRIGSELGVDPSEIERIADAALLRATLKNDQDGDLEDMLGIDRTATRDQALVHLRREFQKWNNRLATLTEGEERENAQRRLQLISKAREKYTLDARPN